ncbi:MAG: DNA-3-methyladenine glycosylase 2 family protein [Oscillospiraceae bacterium]|nr:DNA-3-methyladenine glycosylase 2 family protein [Oscillospiraceae bacterium]
MQYTRIEKTDDFDPVKIFECGQCFRWNADARGGYTGVALGRAARVYIENDGIFISGGEEEYRDIWRGYFDMDRNYSELRKKLSVDDYTAGAAAFGTGIRILKQDRWEALCSFIISQCNNIPRIKKIIETLCSAFGDELSFEGEKYRAFPPADRIAALEPEDLAVLKCGYRAEYIISAAREVASGRLDLDALALKSCAEAVTELKKLHGVGDKVANCVVLFGLQIPDAFPIDVWMKKALKEHYPPGFDPSVFGDAAGLAQQYIFYYTRSGPGNGKQ